MKLSVRNYRALRTADIEIGNGVTLVAGANDRGKTSLVEALRATLTGDPVCLLDADRPKQKDAAVLVHTGEATGLAALVDGENKRTVTWPNCEVTTEGMAPPAASAVAAGMVSPAFLPLKERSTWFIQALRVRPTLDDFKAWLKDHGIPDNVVQPVWDVVADVGWDKAQDRAQQVGAQTKGRWREVTGEQWGEEKGAYWTPKGYEAAWDTTDLARLAHEIEDLEHDVRNSGVNRAQTQGRLDELGPVAESLQRQEAAMAQAIKSRDKLTADLAALRDNAPEDVPDTGLPCPHCGEGIWLKKDGPETRLRKVGPKLSDSERKKLRHAVLDHMEKIKAVERDLQELGARIPQLETMITQAKRAAALVPELRKSLEETATDPQNTAAEKLAKAIAKRTAVEQCRNAKQLHIKIVVNAKVQGALSPNGVRLKVLEDKLAKFRARLAELAEIAKLSPVILADDMRILVGSLPYALCAESVKFRARAVLQMALAEVEKPACVAIDADVDVDKTKDRPLFQALIRMINATGIPAVLVMHEANRAAVPDLAKAPPTSGLQGRTYWIEDNAAWALQAA